MYLLWKLGDFPACHAKFTGRPKKMKPSFLLHGFWRGFASDTRDMDSVFLQLNFQFWHTWFWDTIQFQWLPLSVRSKILAPNSGATSQSETSSQPRRDRKLGFLHLRQLRLVLEDPTIFWRWFYMWLAGFLTHQQYSFLWAKIP